MSDSLGVAVAPHPLLDLGAFTTEFPAALGELTTPAWLLALFKPGSEAPLERDEDTRQAVRELLRHGGYKPTGRGKPASEYLVRAAQEGKLGSINLAVDVCNAVSLHSGLPVSLVDLDRAASPFHVALAAAGQRYIFNRSGQVMDVTGLLCLHDAQGPAANAVKDSERTKTHAGTTRTLSVVWGSRSIPGRTASTVAWYRETLSRVGGKTSA